MPKDTQGRAAQGTRTTRGDAATRGAWTNGAGLTPAQLKAAERVTRAHADRLEAWLRQLGRGDEAQERITEH